MKMPNLAEAAQFAEVIAAVAVVVSLIYVGRELRSNTAATRAESLQGVADASAQILLTTASDSTLSRIRQVGNRDVSLLTDAEAFRYGTLLRQSLLAMQNVYFQKEFGVLDSRVWAGYQAVICDLWSNPGVRATWNLHRHVLDTDFAEVVESCPTG
jgi:hypothetical protein